MSINIQGLLYLNLIESQEEILGTGNRLGESTHCAICTTVIHWRNDFFGGSVRRNERPS